MVFESPVDGGSAAKLEAAAENIAMVMTMKRIMMTSILNRI
jgi:hypothetical protein